MENYTLKTRPFYSDSFKLMVIKRVVSGELTREGARRVNRDILNGFSL